jgi:uncharacterized membrane protein YbhN (UPF0104 family)
MTKPIRRSRLIQAAKTLITVIMVYYLLRLVDWRTLLPLLKPDLIIWLVGAFLIFVLAELVIAWRWSRLLMIASAGFPLGTVSKYVFISMFTSNFLPGTISGDVVKMVGLSRQRPENRSIVVASVIVDRLYNLAGMILMTPFALGLNWQFVSSLWPWIKQPTSSAAVTPAAGLWQKAGQKLAELWQVSRGFARTPGMVLRFLAYSILSSQLSFVSFFLVCLGLGIHVSYPQMMLICVLSYFSGLLPVSINGLGVQEGVFSFLLVQMGAGLPAAVAAAFLTRLIYLFVSLIGGVWLGLEKTGKMTA